eukprot:scaffold14714_cov32-Tisochrysis_lutea.AAC.1
MLNACSHLHSAQWQKGSLANANAQCAVVGHQHPYALAGCRQTSCLTQPADVRLTSAGYRIARAITSYFSHNA